jgi:hypothetical protein
VLKVPIRPEQSDEEYPKDEESKHINTFYYNWILKDVKKTGVACCTQKLRTVFIVFHIVIFIVINLCLFNKCCDWKLLGTMV